MLCIETPTNAGRTILATEIARASRNLICPNVDTNTYQRETKQLRQYRTVGIGQFPLTRQMKDSWRSSPENAFIHLYKKADF
jgi:hypothetical protein